MAGAKKKRIIESGYFCSGEKISGSSSKTDFADFVQNETLSENS